MKLFWNKRLEPQQVAEKIFESFNEEQLKTLNSCPTYKFNIALLTEFCSKKLKFKYWTFEEALPEIERLIDMSNTCCDRPITERELLFFCMRIKDSIFYET